MKKISLIALLLLCAPFVAHAAGGACPSGANYINPANNGVAGPLVSLSSFGVTSCFYIGANGSDANAGTSEAAPWQHAPGMPGCVNGSACHITPTPGEGFIFRGGDTWHAQNKAPSNGVYIGTPSGTNQWDWVWTGTAGNYIYIGVDPGWSASAPWTRPVITNDNPVVAGGIVSNCINPMGNRADVVLDGVQYVQFDNFEFTGMCWNDVPNNGGNVHDYLVHFGNGPSYLSSFRIISNLYIHGWTHVPFNCNGGSGPVCSNPVAGIMGDTHLEAGTQIIFNVCDGSDSDDLAMNCIFADGYTTAYNVIRHMGGTNILNNCHSIHDNLFEYVNNDADGATHSDMWFCVGEAPSDNFFYNNLVRFIGTEYNVPLSAVF
jgi:hypothetical protein